MFVLLTFLLSFNKKIINMPVLTYKFALANIPTLAYCYELTYLLKVFFIDLPVVF